jgi:hypothetical protein
VNKVVLPDSRTAALRLSKSAGSREGKAMTHQPEDTRWVWLAAPLDPAGWIAAAAVPFIKGQERVYPPGTRAVVYFDGALSFDRGAVLASQPAPYQGPPQVFFTDTANFYRNYVGNFQEDDILFCDEVRVGPFSEPLRLAVKAAGTLSAWGRSGTSPEGRLT